MLTIETLDGIQYNIEEYGMRVIDFQIDAPSPRYVTETAEGRDGDIDLGGTYGPRNIRAKFKVKAVDTHDSQLLRNDIFQLFFSHKTFYLISKYEPGKRWKVKTAASFTPSRINHVMSEIEVNFVCNDTYAESIPTTLSLKEWDVDLWQWGMGIEWEDYNYIHNVNSFVIYNASNVVIDPRFMDLVITIKATASEYIELVNQTAGETYRYNGALTTSDTLKIDGIRSTKNNLSVFRQTNKKLITLNPGENQFIVNGTSVIESISFEFRFKYL